MNWEDEREFFFWASNVTLTVFHNEPLPAKLQMTNNLKLSKYDLTVPTVEQS